jgi:recA bacterial DNA recombination protein
MALARAALESLLRTRQLDRTLTTALPALPAGDAAGDEYAIGSTGVDHLDCRLGGGLPRGQVSEVIGRRTSGRMSVLLRMLAAATQRGELVAVVDALDVLDVASLEAAGVALERLLWIRGHVVINPGMCRDLNQRAMEQAIRALSLVLQAGNFGLVVLDVAEAPAETLRRLPFTTWLRLQRMVEGSQTIAVLVGNAPMARSAAGLTIRLDTSVAGPGLSGEGPGDAHPGSVPRLLQGLDVDGRIVRARVRGREDTHARFATEVSVHV